jgi:hypothetical protein
MVRKPHKLECRVVTVTETKLTCIKLASFFSVSLDYFQNDFLEQLDCCGQEANRT